MGLTEFEAWARIASLLVAVPAFAFAVVKYSQDRRVEANRPFLDRQLALYTDVTRAAATLATSSDQALIDAAQARFMELFWGELALVEDPGVEHAMIAFRAKLVSDAGEESLSVLSVRLAHACRESLARSWRAPKWRSHYQHAGT